MPSDNESPNPTKEEEEEEELQQQQQHHSPPSPADSRSEEGEARSDDSPPDNRSERDEKEDQVDSSSASTKHPPLPDEPLPHTAGGGGDAAPPLPDEAPPTTQQSDDGWSAEWDAARQAWYFYNRFTGVAQWDNPRVPSGAAGAEASSSSSSSAAVGPRPPATTISEPTSVAGGYNPAIHGSWDPNASYAQAYKTAIIGDEDDNEEDIGDGTMMEPLDGIDGSEDPYVQNAAFNSRTGKFQTDDQNPDHYSDAAKSQRQMNAYFDVDRAANAHDGRSLKAERRGKQPTRKELAMWKEKRKAKKEEKRRAWLRD